MRASVRLLSLSALLVPLILLARPPSQTEGAPVVLESTSHTVEIEYSERHGALRRATVRITPREGRPSWRGEIGQLAFWSAESGWHVLTSRTDRRGAYEARGRVPAPDQLGAFAIRTATGSVHTWRSPAQSLGDDDKDKPKEPDPDDPGTDDPGTGGDRNGDSDQCTNVCMELINPWTCECTDTDPWGNEERRGPGGTQKLSFGI